MHRKWPKCEILRRSEVAQCGLRAQGTPLRPAAAPAHGGRTRSKGPRNARNSQIYGSRFRPRIAPENSGLPRGQGRHTGPSDRLKAGLTRHPLAQLKHPARGVAPTRRPRTKFCLYRSVAMLSGRATACSDCRQSTVSCAVLCAPFRAHLTRQTRHHVTLSRPVRFRWRPVRPRRCSGPGQLPSHRPGGAAACRVRRQSAGDTGVLPSQGHVAVRNLWATAISQRSPRRANGSIGHLLLTSCTQ